MKKLLLLLFVVPMVLQAQSTFNFKKFDKTASDFILVGDASIRDGNIQLTPADEWQGGAAWYKNKVNVSEGFVVQFRFQIIENGGSGPGADGFAFVIKNNDYLIGQMGEGIGYGGMHNCIAIEFDTYDNYEGSDNHISVQTNGRGRVSRHNYHSVALNHSVPLLKGKEHLVTISYAEKILKVYVDGKICIKHRMNISKTLSLDNSKAWIGFTSATAKGYSSHQILNMQYASRAKPRASIEKKSRYRLLAIKEE